jgi:hypothetical protein
VSGRRSAYGRFGRLLKEGIVPQHGSMPAWSSGVARMMPALRGLLSDRTIFFRNLCIGGTIKGIEAGKA